MNREKYYLEFTGVSCSGCVLAIEQKIEDMADLHLQQISQADGSVVCSVEKDAETLIGAFTSFKGCCDSCEIALSKAELLSEEEYEKIDLSKKDTDILIREQYKVALQRALNNEEVACSEHCVCKTTNIDRLDEFQEAPSFASVYNLSELVQEYLAPGFTVIDFGCGTGHDAFRIAPLVPQGTVRGIDITPEMVEYANRISRDLEYANVQFTTGSDLSSVSPDSIDVIYTNNVFNILEDKSIFLRQSYIKLRSGGKLVIADEFAIDSLPEKIQSDPEYRCGGISGAMTKDQIGRSVEEVGFSLQEVINVRSYEIHYDDTEYRMETSIIIAQKRMN